MFEEFNKKELKEWLNISEEKQLEYLKNMDVTMVFDISLKVTRNGRLYEEHNFYQVNAIRKTSLIEGISTITRGKKIILNYEFESETYEVEPGKKLVIKKEIGPFSTEYVILVKNVRYGKIYDI